MVHCKERKIIMHFGTLWNDYCPSCDIVCTEMKWRRERAKVEPLDLSLIHHLHNPPTPPQHESTVDNILCYVSYHRYFDLFFTLVWTCSLQHNRINKKRKYQTATHLYELHVQTLLSNVIKPNHKFYKLFWQQNQKTWAVWQHGLLCITAALSVILPLNWQLSLSS